MTERFDPVVYGNGKQQHEGPLTAEQVAFYRENGYLLFTSLFTSDEVRTFQDELTRLRSAEGMRGTPEIILEPGGNEIRSIFAVHESNRLLRRLACDRRLVHILTQLLDSSVYIHQSRINYKPGFVGKEFYWHSDFETWHMEDGMPNMRAISCSISLSENNEFNGPLMLIPGSHKHYIVCVGQTPENHYQQSLKKQEYGVPAPEMLEALVAERGIVTQKGPAGSVAFFECNVMHGSNSNITPWPRNNIFFVYNSMENTLVEPFCGLAPRPQFIASRDFTPVEPV
jgi:ectoine hydroxylase